MRSHFHPLFTAAASLLSQGFTRARSDQMNALRARYTDAFINIVGAKNYQFLEQERLSHFKASPVMAALLDDNPNFRF